MKDLGFESQRDHLCKDYSNVILTLFYKGLQIAYWFSANCNNRRFSILPTFIVVDIFLIEEKIEEAMLLPIKPICQRKDMRKDGTSLIFIQYCCNSDNRTLLNTEIAIPS